MRIEASLVVKEGTLKIRAYPPNTANDGSYDTVVSTGFRVNPDHVISDDLKVSGTANDKEINAKITEIVDDLDKIVNHRLDKRWPVSAKIVSIVYKTKQHPEEKPGEEMGSLGILTVWKRYTDRLEAAKLTVPNAYTVKRDFEKYLKSTMAEAYKQYGNDVPLFMLSKRVRIEYDEYVKLRNLTNDTLANYGGQMKAVLDFAIAEEYVENKFLDNKFQRLGVRSDIKEKHRPIPDEVVKKIYALNIHEKDAPKKTKTLIDRIQKCYIFQIETGLAFACLKNVRLGPVSPEKGKRGGNIYFDTSLQKWVLSGYRWKTGSKYMQIMSDRAVELYKYFMSFPKKKNQRGIFPVYDIVSYNRALKLIALYIEEGINLTAHMPRHTFASRKAAEGTPKDLLMDMMGLTSLKILNSVYAQMSPKRQEEFSKILAHAQEMYNQTQNRTISL